MRNLILNAKGKLEGDTLTVQIAPVGSYPGVMHMKDGKTKDVTQNLDENALRRVANAWREAGANDLLVDADHTSVDGGSTEAYAWASNLRVEPERGLVADFTFTPKGKEAINSRQYRFVSPVFECDSKGQAVSLENIALTNMPNLPVSCVLNRTEPASSPVQEKETDMEKLKEELGLGADATEADAIAAVQALKKRAEDAQAAVVENEAEKAADEHKEQIENREEFKRLYIKNGRDVALAFLGAMKKPSQVQPAQKILNAKANTVPSESANALREGLAKCKNAKERVAYVTTHAKEFAEEAKSENR